MAERLVFLQSANGARQRSPLGAFICNRVVTMEILTSPLFVEVGSNHVVTGVLFGSTQGSGSLKICNTPDGSDVAYTQSIVSWSDTSITFTTGTLPDGDVFYILVTNNSSATDFAVTQTLQISGTVSVTTGGYSISTADSRYSNCGLMTDASCASGFSAWASGCVVDVDQNDLLALGYITAATGTPFYNFFLNTPGFTIHGETSGNSLALGYRDHVFTGLTGDRAIWCNQGGSLQVTVLSDLELLYSPNACVSDSLTAGDRAGTFDSGGWTNGETVYIVLASPVSLGITSHVSGFYTSSTSTNFTGYAFDSTGDIGASIAWTSSLDGSLGTGSSITTSLSVGTHTITASVTNADGQYRQAQVVVKADTSGITAISPNTGDVAGGTSVTITGFGFPDEEFFVEFDGEPATNVTWVNSTTITCDTPAYDPGLVPLDVYADSVSYSIDEAFTYTE